MANPLRRFVARAPRYILRPNDNQMLRFAPNHVHNRSFSTRFVNVSETGLAFIIDRTSAPRIGEFLKVEFPVPGGEQIAWFAKVVRLEEVDQHPWWNRNNPDEDPGVLVGLQFHQLPRGHREAIRLHLQEKFHDIIRAQRYAKLHVVREFLNEHGWKILMNLLSTLLTFGILYLLSRPTPSYDPERGSPWGQRIKFGE